MSISAISSSQGWHTASTDRFERHTAGPFPEEFHQIVEFSILASQQNPFDPMEVAFREFGERHLAGTEHLHPDWQLIREYPLTREMLSMSRVWRPGSYSELIVAAKGAPEAISRLCLALIWTIRSWTGTIVQTFRSRNVELWAVTASALTLLGLVLNVPFLNGLFRISNLDFRDVGLCVLAGLASIVWFEALKLFVRLSRGPIDKHP